MKSPRVNSPGGVKCLMMARAQSVARFRRTYPHAPTPPSRLRPIHAAAGSGTGGGGGSTDSVSGVGIQFVKLVVLTVGSVPIPALHAALKPRRPALPSLV